MAEHLGREYAMLKVTGKVRAAFGRGAVNPNMATGEIEVLASAVTVLNTSVTPPFSIEDGIETDETTRMKWRYLDLRRPEMYAEPEASPCGCPGNAHGAEQARLPRGRNAYSGELHALKALATTSFLPVRTRASSTLCPKALSSSSRCSWWAASSAITRLPAASATRTCAPTASLSSPRLISRCRSLRRTTLST